MIAHRKSCLVLRDPVRAGFSVIPAIKSTIIRVIPAFALAGLVSCLMILVPLECLLEKCVDHRPVADFMVARKKIAYKPSFAHTAE